MKSKKMMILMMALLAISLGLASSYSNAGLKEAPADAAVSSAQPEERKETDAERIDSMELEEMELGMRFNMLERLSNIAFSPEQSAMVAIGAIKDDLDIEPKEAAKILVGLLGKVKSQGLRNTIYLSLKDLYFEMDMKKEALGVLMEMIVENDGQLMKEKSNEDDDDGHDD